MKATQSKLKRNIWQQLKNILLGSALFLFAAITTFIIFLSLNADKVKGMLISELDSRLKADLYIGELHFSALKSFPMASLTFQDVLILSDDQQKTQDTLAQAAFVELNFNMLDFFRQEYTLRHLSVENGSVNPIVYPNRDSNYLLWESDTPEKGTSIHFDIHSLNLKQVHVRYMNEPAKYFIDVAFEDMQIKSSKGKELRKFSLLGSFTGKSIRLGDTHLPSDLYVHTNVKAGLDDENSLFLEESRLTIHEHHFIVDGIFRKKEDLPYADATVAAENLNTALLLKKFPPAWKRFLKPYNPSGELTFKAHIKGFLHDAVSPAVACHFFVKNGNVAIPGLGLETNIQEGQGSYLKRADSSFGAGKIDITHVVASAGQSSLQGKISLDNLRKPKLSFQLQASLSPGKLLTLYPYESLHQAGGNVDLDINFSGLMSEGNSFTHKDLLSSRLSGQVKLHDVSFIVNDKHHLPYHGIEAHMNFQDNTLQMKSLRGKAGTSDFQVTGIIQNVLPWLFVPGEKADVEASLTAEYINMDEILQHHTHEADTIYRLSLPSRMEMQMQADVGRFRFRDFVADDVSGHARITNQQFFADHLELNAMGGRIIIEGLVDGRPQDQLEISCMARLEDVDIHQLFFQTGNFGQNGITHENLHGRVTAGLHFSSSWSSGLQINWDAMETTANLTIKNGRLVDYHPLIALGRYIRTSDLSDVTFSTLENEIHIHDRIITMPQMEIASSALDLKLSGQHNFDNEIDYRLQVLLSDILAREHRERRNPQEQYGDIIDDGLGRTALFLRLTGDFNNPQFRYDHQGVREKLRDDLREERKNMRQILRDEFRFLSREKNEDIIQEKTTRERLKKQEEGEFIIEWEELD